MAAGRAAEAKEPAETDGEGAGATERTEVQATEALGSKEGAEEGTGDERKGAEDAGRPTGDCGRKKAAASENGRAGAEIDDPADETATGGCPATTGGISEASGEPARLASGANNDGEPTEAGEGGFWPEPASPGKRVNEFIVL